MLECKEEMGLSNAEGVWVMNKKKQRRLAHIY